MPLHIWKLYLRNVPLPSFSPDAMSPGRNRQNRRSTGFAGFSLYDSPCRGTFSVKHLALSGALLLAGISLPGFTQFQAASACPAPRLSAASPAPSRPQATALPASASSRPPLKLATWNLEWLMDENGALAATAPPDRPHRTPADFEKLAAYAQHLNADLVGLQEVDSVSTAERLFPARTYQIFITRDALLQHPALALRKPLRAHQNPDVTDLDITPATAPHHLRSGLDITVETGTTPLRVLVVHLKTGCQDNPVSEQHHACPILLRQFAVLQNWISARAAAHEAFVIMGDFNRRLTEYDPFYLLLSHQAPLRLTTAGWSSPCAGGTYFIDHILLGGAALRWDEPNSLHVMTYRADTQPATLSDHCAVSVRLAPTAETP